MLNKRTITLLILTGLPVLIYIGISIYALLQVDLFFWTWLIPASWLLTWGVSRFWKPRAEKPQAVDLDIPDHWTEQDKQAVLVVQEHQISQQPPTSEQLTDPHFYLSRAEDMALALAKHYHPKSTDAYSSLTVSEVMAATRLAVDDLEEWMINAGVGSHLVTISWLKKLKHLPMLSKMSRDAIWLGSLWWNPLNLGKLGVQKLTQPDVNEDLKSNFIQFAYAQFIQLVGFYLIEMNSGRLKGGASYYQQHFPNRFQQRLDGAESQSTSVDSLTFAIVGQVKAGKSSLVNLLMGEHQANTDVLPETSSVNRYAWVVPESGVNVTLLDTPGYADAEITKTQQQEIQQAAQDADIILLVLAANSPAKEADQKALSMLADWQQANPKFKQAPIIGCVTHVDLLKPSLEWNPPYDWREPTSPKAESIYNAIEYAEELFGAKTQAIVPICTDVERDRASAIETELMPALIGVLDDAHSVAMVKAYSTKMDQERWDRMKSQLIKLGKQAAWKLLESQITLNTFKGRK